MTEHVAPQQEPTDDAAASPRPDLPEAALDDLPDVLVSPPWTQKRRHRPPREIPGLRAPAPRLVGRGDEFERAMALEPDLVEWDPDTYWEQHAGVEYEAGWKHADRVLAQLARHGAAIADDAVKAIADTPVHARALLPIRSTPAAATAAHWCLRLDAGRGPGLDWFDRHGLHAVPLLVPEAFGPKGYQRTTARGALRLLAWRYGPEAVITGAEPHGAEAVDATAAVLADHPDRPLLTNPIDGSRYNPRRLPHVLTADRAAILPPTAVAHLIAVLSQWSPRTPYPAVETVAAACDPASLARFSLALARRNKIATWPIAQLGRFGGAEAADLVEARILKAGRRDQALVAIGLETLEALPVRYAFPALYRLSRARLHRKVKASVAPHLARVAARKGSEVEPLADRLAPTLGLDDPAHLTLDFGPRAFHVKFDERLKLRVTDAAGKSRARLPRPGVRDDPEAAAAAIERYRTLNKRLNAELAFQGARLETAMLAGRVWRPGEFARLLDHPVLASLARGLLWLGETPDGPRGFRLAEDGSFADVDDKPLELAADARVRLAHPALLGADLPQWTEVFADYEILQPFDQLNRPALTLTPEEARTGVLDRFTGAVATFGDLNRVFDWKWLFWGETQPEWAASGYTHRFARDLPREMLTAESAQVVANAHLLAEIDPSPDYGDPDPEGRHRILQIWFAPTKNRRADAPTLRGDALDPVPVAEILADLGRATGLHH